MHGSSSVPQEWLETIRKFGGDIKETYGVPVEEIQRGIKSGVRKINIDTDIRLAMTGAMRKVMFQKPDEFDPRAFLKAATAAARDVVKARFEAFGCAGQASKIKVLPLTAMAEAYVAEGQIEAPRTIAPASIGRTRPGWRQRRSRLPRSTRHRGLPR
jgi:fructose-bisphosphate aldolase, class II